MVDQESAHSDDGRQSPLSFTVPTKPSTLKGLMPSKEGRGSRHASPARLSTELTLKVRSQMSRVASIRSISKAVPSSHEEITLAEVTSWLSQVDELHKAFLKEHTYFEVTWPEGLLDHDYFASDTHHEEAQLVGSTKLKLNRLKQELTGTSHTGTAHCSDNRQHSRLPDIKLPTFNGEYSAWPAFRELFSSVVMANPRLHHVEKLHYLRSCVSGPAAQLIKSLPLTASSLEPSWDLLTLRFENKRLLIQTHLDKLYNLTPSTARNAPSLTKLVTTVSEAKKALESLGITENMWDCLLVAQISRYLDRDSREAWETSLGTTQDYPRFEQLEEFLTARARALERVEAAPSHSVNSPKKTASASKAPFKRATAHQVSAQPATSAHQPASASSSTATYPCDMCEAQHFIVMCPKFRELTPAQRRDIAVKKRLCYNCLGRHNVKSCRSTRVCKTCLSLHHTMLHVTHEASTSAQPTSSEATSSE